MRKNKIGISSEPLCTSVNKFYEEENRRREFFSFTPTKRAEKTEITYPTSNIIIYEREFCVPDHSVPSFGSFLNLLSSRGLAPPKINECCTVSASWLRGSVTVLGASTNFGLSEAANKVQVAVYRIPWSLIQVFLQSPPRWNENPSIKNP